MADGPVPERRVTGELMTWDLVTGKLMTECLSW